MFKAGITGCMGSGKSTIARIFMQLGIPVYDADSQAKKLMVASPTLISKIQSIFGAEAYTETGVLNRTHIAEMAFSNPHLLQSLNEVVHPAVIDDFDLWAEAQDAPYVIKEAALMFESDSYKQLDKIIVVTAPEELRITRSLKRDNTSRDAVLKRMKNQWPEEEKLKRAHYEIKNDEETLVIPQVLSIHNQLLQLTAKTK